MLWWRVYRRRPDPAYATFIVLGKLPHAQGQLKFWTDRLRGTGGKLIRLKDGMGRSLGATDFATALRELHPGAVHLHQGEHYLVASLDLERGIARLLPHIEDYYTQPRSETDIEILNWLDDHSRYLLGCHAAMSRSGRSLNGCFMSTVCPKGFCLITVHPLRVAQLVG